MRTIILLALMALSQVAFPGDAEESTGASYVDGSQPITSIEDHHREADAWAMCAAAYDTISEIYKESKPAVSKRLSEMANGAELAVTMAIFTAGLKTDMSPQAFSNLWEAAKHAGSERPKSQKVWIDAQAELLPPERQLEVISDLAATVKVCINNVPSQQAYIDTWREMSTTAAFHHPAQTSE